MLGPGTFLHAPSSPPRPGTDAPTAPPTPPGPHGATVCAAASPPRVDRGAPTPMASLAAAAAACPELPSTAWSCCASRGRRCDGAPCRSHHRPRRRTSASIRVTPVFRADDATVGTQVSEASCGDEAPRKRHQFPIDGDVEIERRAIRVSRCRPSCRSSERYHYGESQDPGSHFPTRPGL